MTTTGVHLEQLNAASAEDFVDALANIYEHSPWVAAGVAGQRPFVSLAALNAAMVSAVRGAPPAQRLALIKLHPDLAGKAARAGAMTLESTAEQGSAGLDRLSETEYARFHHLNDAYREKFHIPFIICVRRHTRESILRQYERCLQNQPEAELETALGEICRIAALRLNDRVEAADALPVAGHLSTHVLDTHGGCPAGGVALTLSELGDDGGRRLIVKAVTDHEGRTGTLRKPPRGQRQTMWDAHQRMGQPEPDVAQSRHGYPVRMRRDHGGVRQHHGARGYDG